MGYEDLIGQALGAGSALLGQGMKSGGKGMGGGIGSAAGGLIGTAFGGPLGAAVGGAAGGLLGQGIEALAGGGQKRKAGPRKKRARRAAAAAPAAAAALAAQQGVAPVAAAKQMAAAAATVAAAKQARGQISDAIGAKVATSASGYRKLARAAGVNPILALTQGLSPGALVRRAGLERVGKALGMGGAAKLAAAVGLPTAVVRATGLAPSAAEHAAVAPQSRARAKRLILKRARAAHRRYSVQLSGLSDGPLDPGVPGVPGGKLSSASGPIPKVSGKTPGAVPVQGSQWDFDANQYVLAWGDTLTGLAATYLGSGGRWKEVWDKQPAAFRQSHSPDKLGVGQRLDMPAEAVANAKTLLATPGAKVQPNGQVVDPKSGQVVTAGLSPTAKVAVAVAGLAALGGLAYVVAR